MTFLKDVHALGQIVPFLSHVQLFETPWTAGHQASLSFTVCRSLLKFMSVELVRPSNQLIFCHPLLLLSIFSSNQGLFQWVSSSYQVAKILELQLQHQSSNEYSGLIFFRIDWFDHLAVQGTHKSLLQHYSSKPSILWCSSFFMVQLLDPYMTTGKTIALTILTFFGKVMSLLFNTLSRFVLGFLVRRKHL